MIKILSQLLKRGSFKTIKIYEKTELLIQTLSVPSRVNCTCILSVYSGLLFHVFP